MIQVFSSIARPESNTGNTVVYTIGIIVTDVIMRSYIDSDSQHSAAEKVLFVKKDCIWPFWSFKVKNNI